MHGHRSIARHLLRTDHLLLAVFAVILVVVILWSNGTLTRVRENVMFALSPSTQRAYEYGNAYFSAKDSRMYDINRAEVWYRKALHIDPAFPGVHHQLARIAFLRGHFNQAMGYINEEINLPNGPVTPSSFYIRGLIEGYMGNYDESANDYSRYLETDPSNWAALNDLSWVLLKADRFQEAAEVTSRGLEVFPTNPWLLNSNATALYELGRYKEALTQVQKARDMVANVSEQQWLTAYPGNDPKIARSGLDAFNRAIEDNLHTISSKVETGL